MSNNNLKNGKLLAMRHSCEHVLHTAMQNLYPKLLKAMGPATEDGFYFDFDLDEKINESDFPKIEAEMQKIIDKNYPIIKKEISESEAKKFFKDNLYKLEWIKEIKDRKEKFTTYSIGDIDTDLCSGPHVKSTGSIGPFKLLSIAGAYWRGSEKNKMLTRIYGAVFPTKKELDIYLEALKSEKEMDHRKIGKDLELFVFSDLVGAGLPLFTEKGATIRRELERFIQDEEIKRGYKHVITPPLAKTELYKTSGHYPYYKDTMYPVMKVDEDELILRPMTCPHHFMLYKSKPRSYKDLPIRYGELASQFRYEKSGELSGLMRVRMFCLADAHIFVRINQAENIIKEVLDLIEYVALKMGLHKGLDFRYRLSLGDRKDEKKYYKDDKSWDKAEEILRKVLKDSKAPFYEAEGEAAFYGPKIDIQMKKVSGKEETAFTVQYDFVMPKRFELRYINEKGKEEEPVVIHRSSIGAIERVMALLIEKYMGNFPTWLTPVQVKVLPISTRHTEYAVSIVNKLLAVGIRTEIDDRNETLGAKIRDAQKEKVSYMLVVGDREEKEGTVSERGRSGKDYGSQKLEVFIESIKNEIDNKIID